MRQTFLAELKKVADIDASYVEIPFDVQAVYGQKRVKVKASIDGVTYQGSLVRMDKAQPHTLIITQAIRRLINKQPGDRVSISLEPDKEERTLGIPTELAHLLAAHPSEQAFFNQLSYTNRKEYVQWLVSAKRAETQIKRLDLILIKLKARLKNPSDKSSSLPIKP